MLLLRLIRWLRAHVPYIVLGLCILQGVIAFLSMFSFPPLALAMVFIGLLTLGAAPVVRWMLGGVDSALTRLLGAKPDAQYEDPS